MINFNDPDRLLSLSKSMYRRTHPDNLVVFNANICTKERGKIWQGDLDVTEDIDELKRLASEIKEEIYVLREMDARFSTEKNPRWEAFVVRVTPRGDVLYPAY